MRKMTNRAFSLLLIAALVIAGMGWYILEYINKGSDWAMYFSRMNSGSSGVLTDRNGQMLARFDNEAELFSSDEQTRIANYHVTGDYWGRTGAGVLSRYWSGMQGFSLLTGTTKGEDSILRLSIDSRLNRVIHDQLYSYAREDTKALMMVADYSKGEILGLVSLPSADPLGDQSLLPDGAYLNRCLSASFTPGSIFKLITAAAAIEQIEDIDRLSFDCGGEYEIAGVPIKCTGVHGEQSFEQALSNSCNCAFAQIAVKLGQDCMVDYVSRYGFLSSHEVNGISTAKGSYPTEFVGDPELAWSAIGQSTDMICPYSMLRFLCAIGNGGTVIEPSLALDGEHQETQLMPRETADKLKGMMNYTAIDHYKAEEKFPGLALCAKTGTAELGNGYSHAWFVGLLADEEHPYAFVTMVERGGYGLATAGPITNTVLQWAVSHMGPDSAPADDTAPEAAPATSTSPQEGQ